MTIDAESGGGAHSRRVLKGFLAMSGSSVGVMAVQIFYAALTSRILGPTAFGAYAVALSGIGLLGMIGGSSLGQATARRENDSETGDRSLMTVAVLVGSFAAVIAFLLAPLWGRVWAVPESSSVTRVLALSLPFTAIASVLAGVLRRLGRTHAVALRNAVGQLLGIGLGLAVVLSVREPWSLAVTPAAGATFSCVLLSASLPWARQKPHLPDHASLEDVLYGTKAAGMNLVRSGSGQLSQWSISRFAGAASLGAFNRATTLITIPLQTLQTSFNYALFPELRPGGPAFSRPQTFTNIVILVTWPSVLIGAIGYFAAPAFIEVLLGPDWGMAARLASLAVLLGVVPMITVPLGGAVEALGIFRIAALAWLLGLPVLVLGISATIWSQDPAGAMLGMLGSSVVGACTNALGLGHRGLLDYRRLIAGVTPVVVLQIPLIVLLSAMRSALGNQYVAYLISVMTVGILEVALVWSLQRRTTFGRLAAQVGLPGFGRGR